MDEFKEWKVVNHINGNLVYFNEKTDRWVYEDGVDAWDNPRVCSRCKLPSTPEGHDACMGTLKGVDFACCGHGVSQGYISFTDGVTIRFPDSSVDT